MRAEYTSSGTLSTSYDYDPYGVPEGRTTPSDYGFTGEPYDGERGLVHLRARWYAPEQGRFLTRDPFPGVPTRPQSLAPYAYVENSPTSGVDPTGNYRCDWGWPFHQAYHDYCVAQRNRLDSPDSALASLAGNDDVLALFYLFADPYLPGGAAGAQTPAMSPARERLEFVLWYTRNEGDPNDWNKPPFGQFRVVFTDKGFAEEFQDSWLWGTASNNQVGHFLTAAQMAYTGLPDPRLDPIDCIVGHELIGDAPGKEREQCTTGTPAERGKRRELFLAAMQADRQGDRNCRENYLEEIDMSMPGLPSNYAPPDPSRVGNSVQDLRLSLKGWIFGEDIRKGVIITLDHAQNWLSSNLRPSRQPQT